MKKENRSIQFKNYAEGVGAATIPIGLGVVGISTYFGMKWIEAGLGDLDLLIHDLENEVGEVRWIQEQYIRSLVK